jgi:glycosyltransferase involved in cell wall biosynthesis
LKPSISVVIPTYNRAKVLAQSVASVQAQSFPVVEILVCDDGSTDGSRDALRAQMEKDPRIRWLPGEHSGCPGVVRNRGLRAARGEWIAFQDSDDLWLPHKLERQLQVLRQAPAAAFLYSYAAALEADRTHRRMTPFRIAREGRMFETLLFYSIVQTPTVLVRRDLLERVGLFDEAMRLTIAEDYELYLRLAAATPFHFVPEELVHCRAQRDSISADLLGGIDQVERALRAAIEREKVPGRLAARALAKLELRRYKQHLLQNSPKDIRKAQLRAALEKHPGYGLANALLLAETLGCAGLVRSLVRSGIAGTA